MGCRMSCNGQSSSKCIRIFHASCTAAASSPTALSMGSRRNIILWSARCTSYGGLCLSSQKLTGPKMHASQASLTRHGQSLACNAQHCAYSCQDEARLVCKYGPTCTSLLLVHIDHALLLMLVAEGTFLLALPIESRPRVAAVLCTPPMLDIHHALLQSQTAALNTWGTGHDFEVLLPQPHLRNGTFARLHRMM